MTFGDVPIKPPSLLELGATAVGRTPILLLAPSEVEKNFEQAQSSKDAECSSPGVEMVTSVSEPTTTQQSENRPKNIDDKDNAVAPALPAPCVRAILEQLEELWQGGNASDADHDRALKTLTYMSSAGNSRMPIDQLNLRRSRIAEDLLFRILLANASNLNALNLLECDLLESAHMESDLKGEDECASLERRLFREGVELPSLRSLQLDKIGILTFFAENRLTTARCSRLARHTSLPPDSLRTGTSLTGNESDPTQSRSLYAGNNNNNGQGAESRNPEAIIRFVDDMVEGILSPEDMDGQDEVDENDGRADDVVVPPLASADSHDSDLADWSSVRSVSASSMSPDEDDIELAAGPPNERGELMLDGGFVLRVGHQPDPGGGHREQGDEEEMMSGSESSSPIAAANGVDDSTQPMEEDTEESTHPMVITHDPSNTSITSMAVPRRQPITVLCPQLQKLTLHGQDFPAAFEVYKLAPDEEPVVNDGMAVMFLRELLEPLKNLRSLDLSRWLGLDDLRCLLVVAATLTELVLFNVPDLYRAVEYICELKQLRLLDVSQANRDTGVYPAPACTLHRLVVSLPHLRSLDVSATNLPSPASDHDRPPPAMPKVTGDATEAQLIAAMSAYMHRPDVLHSVLNETYQAYRHAGNQQQNERADDDNRLGLNGNALDAGRPRRFADSLHLVLKAMRAHSVDSAVQIACSACLFYIIRQMNMNWQTRRSVVQALLLGMECHVAEATLVRNCCLSLCQFDVPHELMPAYGRAAKLLVAVLARHSGDSVTQRIVVYLLNSMACHVDGVQKKLMGDLNAIETVLQQIERKYAENVCDDVMEVGWSFLWNVTDETEPNCRRFITNRGLELFHKCYEAFPERRKLYRNMTGLMRFTHEMDLIRNMMGLIGNLAEVPSIRMHLTRPAYMRIFCALLTNLSDGIEISYNAAGVLAHVCSDGEQRWTELLGGTSETTSKGEVREGEKAPTWSEVQMLVLSATARWDLRAHRFINYRSFEPILRLVPLWAAPASQHWALWALANLTTVDPDKYCKYVITEGGVPLLQDLKANASQMGGVKNNDTNEWPAEWAERLEKLVDIVMENVNKFLEKEQNSKNATMDQSSGGESLREDVTNE